MEWSRFIPAILIFNVFFGEIRSENIQEYVLNILTYGTKPASFIAQKNLFVIANSIEGERSDISKIIKNNLYGRLSTESWQWTKLIELRESIQSILFRKVFNLRKYCSDNSSLLNSMPAELHNVEQNQVGILGLRWLPQEDSFSVRFDVESPTIPNYVTVESHYQLLLKRSIR